MRGGRNLIITGNIVKKLPKNDILCAKYPHSTVCSEIKSSLHFRLYGYELPVSIDRSHQYSSRKSKSHSHCCVPSGRQLLKKTLSNIVLFYFVLILLVITSQVVKRTHARTHTALPPVATLATIHSG